MFKINLDVHLIWLEVLQRITKKNIISFMEIIYIDLVQNTYSVPGSHGTLYSPIHLVASRLEVGKMTVQKHHGNHKCCDWAESGAFSKARDKTCAALTLLQVTCDKT